MKLQRAGSPQGEPLVLLHGWAMHSGIWQGWLDRLSTWDLWLVDLPGHGRNRELTLPPVPGELAGALLQRVPQGARWLGWSLGGLVALEAALQAPAQVRQLIMLAATPCFVQKPHWPWGKETGLFRQFARRLQQDAEGLLHQFLLLEVQGSPQARLLVRQMQQWLEQAPPPAMPALQTGLQWLEQVDLRVRLSELNCPSLWLAGSHDRLVHPEAMRQAAAMCPQARYAVCEGAVHAPFISHPQWTAQQLEHPVT